MPSARLVIVALCALAALAHAKGSLNSTSLVGSSGWLELHTCQHREEEPYVRGSNIVHPVEGDRDPFTAADDPHTTLKAVFARGYDENLWGRWQVTTREGWGDWEEFGSPNGLGIRDTPVAVADATSLIAVFAIANDGQVYAIYQQADVVHAFSNWTLVGSVIPEAEALATGKLVAVRAKNGRLFVYVDVDGFVYEAHESQPGARDWTAWSVNVFGERRAKSRIAVALNDFTGLLEAFAVLDDNCLYQAWQHKDEVWHDWYSLWECWSQPSFNSNPVVHKMSGSVWNGVLEVFVRGTNNKMWHTWQTTCVTIDNPWSFCTWGAYYEIGGDCPAPVDEEMVDLFVASNIHEGLEVFVTGADGQLYHMWQSEMWGSWSNWISLGHPERGRLTSQPFVVHDRSGWWTAYARGHDGDLEIFVQHKSIQAEPRRVPYGEPVSVSWHVPDDEACADDWLAVYSPQAENDQFLAYVYVNGELNPGNDIVTEGNYNFGLFLPDGIYEIRYLVNRKPIDVLRILVKVSGTSDFTPQEQLFNGITVGLGEKGWDFENCTDNLSETFAYFEEAFDCFDAGDVYRGLNLLGKGIEGYADSMEACSTTALVESIREFASDLISCVVGACARFVISMVADVIIVYMRIHEITMDIMAAENNFAIEAYEQAGVHIGDLIRAVTQVKYY